MPDKSLYNQDFRYTGQQAWDEQRVDRHSGTVGHDHKATPTDKPTQNQNMIMQTRQYAAAPFEDLHPVNATTPPRLNIGSKRKHAKRLIERINNIIAHTIYAESLINMSRVGTA